MIFAVLHLLTFYNIRPWDMIHIASVPGTTFTIAIAGLPMRPVAKTKMLRAGSVRALGIIADRGVMGTADGGQNVPPILFL